jgi:hypothetical protein
MLTISILTVLFRLKLERTQREPIADWMSSAATLPFLDVIPLNRSRLILFR